jgi:predicted phage terminase large subunit-like protein
VRDFGDLLEQLEDEFGLSADAPPVDAALSFVEFIGLVNPKYKWSTMSERLAALLQRVADGEMHRLMIFIPPRHGKSELVSRLFSAYYLYRHPERWVGLNSYAADLAYTFSRAARSNFRDAGGKVSDESSAVKHWETEAGGGCWAAGVGGPITGKGFSLGIIDDPLKNFEEAASKTIREKQKDWYQSTFYTRGEEDAAIVLLQTRWHEDDLSGWLLAQEKGEEPERWHIVSMEAIKTEHPPKIPECCTLEPDWRQPGEALNPVRMSLAKLIKFSKRLGAYFWNALYQQRPAPLEGDFFKRAWWKLYDKAPESFEQMALSVDCAFKETADSDYVVLQVWGKHGGDFYLLDQVRDRMDINGTIQALQALIAKWPKVRARLVEDKANGSAVMDLLKRKTPGLIPINPQGGKVVRAVAVSPYAQSGNIWLPGMAPWLSDFIEEFAAFPNGSHDDQVDALTQAINWLEGNNKGPAQRSGLKLY